MDDRIRELLEKEFPEIDFSTDVDLVDDGIIDSLTLSVIITLLTMEFDITIPKEEINADNFNSIGAMSSMVDKLLKENL